MMGNKHSTIELKTATCNNVFALCLISTFYLTFPFMKCLQISETCVINHFFLFFLHSSCIHTKQVPCIFIRITLSDKRYQIKLKKKETSVKPVAMLELPVLFCLSVSLRHHEEEEENGVEFSLTMYAGQLPVFVLTQFEDKVSDQHLQFHVF